MVEIGDKDAEEAAINACEIFDLNEKAVGTSEDRDQP
jgi:hypothetical protein